MATVGTIRDALKTRLATISGLRTHDVWPDTISVPAALIKPRRLGQEVQFSGNQHRDIYEITVIVQAAGGLGRAQDALDAYVSRTGTNSIEAAIEGDTTLGGNAQLTMFQGWETYGGMEISTVNYLGATATVEVWH